MKRSQNGFSRHSKYVRHGLMAKGLLAGLVVGSIGGCDRGEIHAYRVVRQAESSSAPNDLHGPKVVWEVPEVWEEVENTSTMRIATYKASNEQLITLAAFPGDVGGFLANVNRWRGQVGLDPTDEDGAHEHVEQVEGGDILLVDIAGPEQRLLGTIILVGDGQTWFVKAVGGAEAIEEVKQEVIDFSLTFYLRPHDHERDHGQEDQSHDNHDNHDNHDHDHDHEHEQEQEQVHEHDHASETAIEATPQIQWQQPEQWAVESNTSSFLIESYTSQSGARITLTSLAGDGGGLLGNTNRWRGQVGLDPVMSLDEQPMKDLGNGASLIDLVSSDKSNRMVLAVVPIEGETLFFKLSGSDSQVASEIERFAVYITSKGLRRVGEP